VPLYEYQCKKCKHRFEKIESLSASMTKVCPKCGGKAERTISAPAIQFKGAGWYVNEYGKGSGAKSSENAERAEKGEGKSGEKTGEKAGEKTGEKSGEKSVGKSGDKSAAKAPTSDKPAAKSEAKKKSKE
jgi:putative FmdB family regulatory protein